MSIGTNFPVEKIEELAAQVKKSANDLETTLASLRVAVQRDPSFQGSAADSYDKYIEQWDSGQKQLIAGLHGADGVLSNLAQNLRSLDQQVLTTFGQ